MPIRAVRVNMATNEVDNFFSFNTATALLQANIQALPGFRWIGEADWAPNQNPANGDVWSGTIPATFAPVVIEPVIGAPTTMVDAFARIAAATAAVDAANIALTSALDEAAALVPTS